MVNVYENVYKSLFSSGGLPKLVFRIYIFRHSVSPTEPAGDQGEQDKEHGGDAEEDEGAGEVPARNGTTGEGVGDNAGDYANRGDEDVGSKTYFGEPVGIILEVEREERNEARYDEYPPALALDLAVKPFETLVLLDPGGDEATGSVPGHEKGQGKPRGRADHDVDGPEDRTESEPRQQRERRTGQKSDGRHGVAHDKDQRGRRTEALHIAAKPAEVIQADKVREPGEACDRDDGHDGEQQASALYEAVSPQPNISGTVVSTRTFNT